MKNIFLQHILFLFVLTINTGCQLSYYLKSGYHQALLIKNQEPLAETLNREELSSSQKEKLKLIQDVKYFAEKELGLKPTSNYTTFVDLKRPYVTHIVQVAYPYELKYRLWNFPIVGPLPYKGFFDLEDAKKEEQIYKSQGFDTFVRGVRAYSTLGWMKDPVLSSMLSYDEDDLVNLIIHELTHSTLFIKGSADFNEQLATFVGNKGTELYYLRLGKTDILKTIANKNKDELTFSKFIQAEYELLKNWYQDNPQPNSDSKKTYFKGMQERFSQVKFESQQYSFFTKIELNNASFLGFRTYVNDLSNFEKIYNQVGNMRAFLEKMKKLESIENPDEKIRSL